MDDAKIEGSRQPFYMLLGYAEKIDEKVHDMYAFPGAALCLDPIPPALFRLIKLLVSQREKGFNVFRFFLTRLSYRHPKTYRVGRQAFHALLAYFLTNPFRGLPGLG